MAADATEPRLLLFLSVDVENSTAYKNSARRDEWPLTFKAFYIRFPEYLDKECATRRRLSVPALWKCLGDELVFVVRLGRSTEVLDHLRAFRNATNAYNKHLQGKRLKIRLKAAAWLAGFPVGNSEVRIPDYSLPKAAPRIDYIGPLMDIGFRICRFATRRQFVISVDLALMVLQGLHELKCFFDGRRELRGVLDGKEYPIIWIDMLEDAKDVEDKLRGAHPDQNVLRKFCEDFIAKTGGAIMRPFIEGDPLFNTKPPDWDKRYADACRALLADSDPDKSMIEGPSKRDRYRKPRLVKAASKRLLAEAEKYAPEGKARQRS